MLDVSGNRLSSIPAAFAGVAARLDRLWASENELAGCLPDIWDGAGELVELDLSKNYLTCCLPAALPPSLESLDLR